MRRPKYHIQDFKTIAKNNGGECLSENYNKISEKLHWRCKNNHEWWANPRNILKGSWCKKCASRKAGEKFKKSLSDCIEIAKERNGFCLSKKYENSQTKMIWQCDKGHTWKASYANVKKGTWCKICSQKQTGINRRTSIQYFKDYAKSKNGICLSNDYENQRTKLKFQCQKGHTWETQAGSMKSGKTWCPICAGTFKSKTEKQIQEKLDEVRKIALSKGGKCLSETYINSKAKLKFECSKGHTWETIPLIIKNGGWCNICAVQRVSDTQRDTLQDYIKIIESKGGKCLSKKYISQQKSKIHVECEFGHRWYARPQGLKNGTWCRKCYGTAKSTLREIKNIAKERGGECLSEKYINDMTKMVWKCSENHIWQATPNNIKRGKWCPNCSKGIGERVCRLSFEKIFQKEFNSVRPDWLKNSSGNKMELDGFNPELALAFEHQGRQHYSKTKVNHRFIKKSTIVNDQEKAKICNKLGIKIIYIPEVFTDTKLENLISFITTELDKNNIRYPKNSRKIKLDPIEVYTYTKTKELIEREKRARERIRNEKATVVKLYRTNSGVKIRVKCKNGHELSTTVSQILKGNVCRKCKTE